MQPVSPGFFEARLRAGSLRVRRVYLSQSYGPWTETPHVSYRVDAARGERVVARYSGTVVLPPGGPDVDEFSTRVQVRAGFVVGDREELVTLATLTVYDVRQELSGAVTLTGLSAERAIEDAQFRGPYAIKARYGLAALTELLGVVPVPVQTLTKSNAEIPLVVYESDRWQAVQDVANALRVDVYADHSGGFTVADPPTLADPAVFSVAGSRVTWAETRTRQGVPSVVVVEGDRSGQGAIPRGVWEDANPYSPTYVRGAYGEVVIRRSNPLMKTDRQCQSAARTMGLRHQGLKRQVEVGIAPADFLVPGDVVTIPRPDGLLETHIVDRIPHSSSGVQSLTTRTVGGV